MLGGGEIQKMSHKMGDLVCGGIGAKWGGGRGGEGSKMWKWNSDYSAADLAVWSGKVRI